MQRKGGRESLAVTCFSDGKLIGAKDSRPRQASIFEEA